MTGTAIVSYQERFEKDAAAAAQREARSGVNLSMRGGTFQLGSQSLGQQIAVVIIDSYFENNYFNPAFPYDPDNPLPPICYAFAREKQDLAPHHTMQSDMSWFNPQSPWNVQAGAPSPCSTCKRNEWGSSERGKGKACQNRSHLTIIPAGYFQPPRPRAQPELKLFEDPAHFATADAVNLRLPVTSGENWSKYVTQLSASHRRPPYAVFTEIYLEPHPTSQFKVGFDMLGLLPDELFETITKRVDMQATIPFPPFTAPTAEQREGAAQPAARTAAAGFGRRR